MGDCTLRILVSQCLVADNDPKNDKLVEFRHVVAADSTFGHLVDQIIPQHLATGDIRQATLWDCTLYPHKDRTSYMSILEERAKTLFTLGWFPSATLQVLPVGSQPQVAGEEAYDDAQYNKKEIIYRIDQQKVRFRDLDADIKPSEVLAAVTARNTDMDSSPAQEERALEARIQQRIDQQERLSKRYRRIEDRIQDLQSKMTCKVKNRNAKQQVLAMLIKSRATGRKDLKQQDRRYFHCVVIEDDTEESREEYRFFSCMDTIAAIAKTFAVENGKEAEILVEIVNEESTRSYARLPLLWRVHEAQKEGFLSPQGVCRMIIRIFDPETSDKTPSVEDKVAVNSEDVPERESQDEARRDAPDSSPAGPSAAVFELVDDSILTTLLQSLDGNNKKSSKSTRTVDKVRQMKIKSKAEGDAKRVKIGDRFFVELVEVDSTGHLKEFLPVYMHRNDSIQRLVDDRALGVGDLLVRSEGISFRKVTDTSISFAQAASNGVLENFTRLVFRHA